MRYPLAISALSAALLLSLSPAAATAISGSDTLGAVVSSTNETSGNLGTSTTITLSSANMTFSLLAVGAGDFNVIPIDTMVSLTGTTLDLTNKATFAFNDAAFGDFNPTSISVFGQTPTTLSIFLTGTFTPGTLFPSGSTAPLGASENISLTQTNQGVISLGGTFASPPQNTPVPTPEPMTITLLGAGLTAIGLIGRRRARKA